MKKALMRKVAKAVDFVSELGGGPICLGWTYQPPRPAKKSDSEIKLQVAKKIEK